MIEIRLVGCTLFLTESELRQILVKHPEIWAESLRRGKAIKRTRAAAKRASPVR